MAIKKKNMIAEEISSADQQLIKDIIRREIAKIFFILYAKKSMWGAE